jgi:hypothetical protein
MVNREAAQTLTKSKPRRKPLKTATPSAQQGESQQGPAVEDHAFRGDPVSLADRASAAQCAAGM